MWIYEKKLEYPVRVYRNDIGMARFLMAQPLALKNHPGLFHYPRISLLARNSLLLLNRNPKNSKAGQCSIAPARQVPASL